MNDQNVGRRKRHLKKQGMLDAQNKQIIISLLSDDKKHSRVSNRRQVASCWTPNTTQRCGSYRKASRNDCHPMNLINWSGLIIARIESGGVVRVIHIRAARNRRAKTFSITSEIRIGTDLSSPKGPKSFIHSREGWGFPKKGMHGVAHDFTITRRTQHTQWQSEKRSFPENCLS